MKIPIAILSVWLLAVNAYSQEGANQAMDPRRLVDELLGYQDIDADYEVLYENLLQIIASPLDLNTVTEEELKLIHILNDTQIENFINYRKDQGILLDIYELQVIPGFDPDLIHQMLPFIKVSDPLNRINKSLLTRMFSNDQSYLVARYERTIETKKGFKRSQGNTKPYQGTPDKLYYRFRSSLPGDYSVGLTGEKDSGEKLNLEPRSNTWGFDFTSYHLQVLNKGKLSNIIAGDFQTQFGQGLILGGAFGLGKGGESISTIRKSNVGFLPYTSIHESAYQRGLGLTVQPVSELSISVFYSRTRRDASGNIDSDTSVVTSFPDAGYHRTPGEIEKRKKVIEQNAGVIIQFEKNRTDAGIIINNIHFDTPVKKTPTLYNQQGFRGTSNLNAGVFLNYRLANISFFSEVAQSMHGGRAAVVGLLINAHRNLELAFLYRNYMKDFYSFYANPFSENTQPQNERGIYWGWKYRWSRQYSMSGYADLFTFPWLAFRRYAPSSGYEWLWRGNYQPSRKVSVVIQMRQESKYRNGAELTNLYELFEGIRSNFSIRCDYGVGENIRLKSRVQYTTYNFDGKVTEGLVFVQDFILSFGRFNFTARHGLFETDHYDNRQYVYENDAWSSYSLPAYAGVGVRNYALIEYKIHNNLTLWLRYARTRLLNANQIGSGQDVIEGNTKNDVKLQTRFRF